MGKTSSMAKLALDWDPSTLNKIFFFTQKNFSVKLSTII